MAVMGAVSVFPDWNRPLAMTLSRVSVHSEAAAVAAVVRAGVRSYHSHYLLCLRRFHAEEVAGEVGEASGWQSYPIPVDSTSCLLHYKPWTEVQVIEP